MPSIGAGRSVSRRNTPQSPPKSIANSISSVQVAVKPATRSQSRELQDGNQIKQPSRIQQHGAERVVLSIVAEEQDVIDPALRDAVGDGEGEMSPDQDSDELSLSESAYTSTSRADFLKLDRAAMVDALPDLLHDSDILLSMFINSKSNLEDLRSDILSPQSRAAKRLSALFNTFMISKDAFGSHPEDFIDIKASLMKLLNIPYGGDVPEGSDHPYPILCLANIAQLVARAFTVQENTQSGLDFLEKMFLEFPNPFILNFDAAQQTGHDSDANLTTSSFQLALELRTQFLIGLLQKGSARENFDPDKILREIFYTPDGFLRPVGADEDEPLSEKYSQMFLDRATAIRAHFKTKGSYVDFEAMESSFPWIDCLEQLLFWSRSHAEEMHTQIEQQGGIEVIQEYLQTLTLPSQQLNEIPTARLSEQLPSPLGGEKPVIKKMPLQSWKTAKAGLGNQPKKARDRLARAMEQKEAAEVARAAASQVDEEPVTEITQHPTVSRPTADKEHNLPPQSLLRPQDAIQPTQQTLAVLQVKRAHELQSNKENLGQDLKGKGKASYFDRQASAHQVGWEDSQVGPGPSSVPMESPSKRKRQSDNNDDSEEEDEFENDTRPSVAKRARTSRLQDGGDVLDNFPEARFEDGSNQNQASRQIASATQPVSPQKQQQMNQPSSSAPAGYPSSSNTGIQDDRIPSTFRPVQQRIGYTQEETTRLIELIEEHGTSWKLLLDKDKEYPKTRGGPKLQSRSQVQLKDKARNMKMDFLKAGIRLPTNFDRVALGNRLIDKLDEMRIIHAER